LKEKHGSDSSGVGEGSSKNAGGLLAGVGEFARIWAQLGSSSLLFQFTASNSSLQFQKALIENGDPTAVQMVADCEWWQQWPMVICTCPLIGGPNFRGRCKCDANPISPHALVASAFHRHYSCRLQMILHPLKLF
jgi:hypothetical protein